VHGSGGGLLVPDLDRDQGRDGAVGFGQGSHGEPVPDPGFDVLGVAEACPAGRVELVEHQAPQVAPVAEVELVLESGELPQGLDRRDLLPG
jgi:hypothetical protein